ncbi:hypothetical protein [Burkholderia stagnalis]|uniref:hypothetical protein n=1 Tax=Burkholderia stagnalis TaxID=1503054 RepID=UPI000F8015BE|nr:hypothetical protein [Burkholderia stagnalis]
MPFSHRPGDALPAIAPLPKLPRMMEIRDARSPAAGRHPPSSGRTAVLTAPRLRPPVRRPVLPHASSHCVCVALRFFIPLDVEQVPCHRRDDRAPHATTRPRAAPCADGARERFPG